MSENDDLPDWLKFLKDNPLQGKKVFNVDKAIEINMFEPATNIFKLLKKEGYLSVGKIFKNIGSKDLEILLDKTYILLYSPECVHKDLCRNQMMLYAHALCFCEGSTELEEGNYELKLRKLLYFVKSTEMHRMKIGKANFDKFSMEGNLDDSLFTPN